MPVARQARHLNLSLHSMGDRLLHLLAMDTASIPYHVEDQLAGFDDAPHLRWIAEHDIQRKIEIREIRDRWRNEAGIGLYWCNGVTEGPTELVESRWIGRRQVALFWMSGAVVATG